VSTEEDLLRLLEDLVRASKPPILIDRPGRRHGASLLSRHRIILSSKRARAFSFRVFRARGLGAAAEKECILCVNPGSTSTSSRSIGGSSSQPPKGVTCPRLSRQHREPDEDDRRMGRAHGVAAGDLTGIACRGGFIAPCRRARTGSVPRCSRPRKARIVHASNMAIPIGLKIKEEFSGSDTLLVTTTDAVASDEMEIGARMTGIRRISPRRFGRPLPEHPAPLPDHRRERIRRSAPTWGADADSRFPPAHVDGPARWFR